jgi:hypothetical protein
MMAQLTMTLSIVLLIGVFIWDWRAGKKSNSRETESHVILKLRKILGGSGFFLGIGLSFLNPHSIWIGFAYTAPLLIAIGLGNFVYYDSLADTKLLDHRTRRQMAWFDFIFVIAIASYIAFLLHQNQILQTQLDAAQTISQQR